MLVKKYFSLFLLILMGLNLSACMPRYNDGYYQSKYSYHPYNEMYPKKTAYTHQVKQNPTPTPKKSNYYKDKYYQPYQSTFQEKQTKFKNSVKSYTKKAKEYQTNIKKVLKNNNYQEFPSNMPSSIDHF